MQDKQIPDFLYEQKLWQQGLYFVAGLDEAGRGPLAGPVCAGAVCVSSSLRAPLRLLKDARARSNPADGNNRSGLPAYRLPVGQTGTGRLRCSAPRNDSIKDSKKLSANQRDRWYDFLTMHREIKWGIGIVSEKIIDQINILEATKLAMKRALENLEKKGVSAEYLLLDGNFLLGGLSISQKAVARGDEKIWSCAAASIIAKVTRDRLMVKYHKKYPVYGFDKHKGYGTARHLAAIKQHGPCAIHRRSFAPCR